MDLAFKRFRREDYDEYASWFVDPEMNRHLGPMDEFWLEAVLSQPESAGVTWAVFRGLELVAVVETVFDSEQRLPVGIDTVGRNHVPGKRRAVIRRVAYNNQCAIDVERLREIAAALQFVRSFGK